MMEEIKFKDLKIGDIFISSDNALGKDELYMKVHLFDFWRTISENKCLNLRTGNVFAIDPETKVFILANLAWR